MQLEVLAADLPFRRAFRHAAATRKTSESLFVKCVTDARTTGFGESLPRHYVTGETRDAAFALLEKSILPNLVGMHFSTMEDVYAFLRQCDGHAPSGWLGDTARPQLAAWCAVELALLDAFGRAFAKRVRPLEAALAPAIPYSGVVSAAVGWKLRVSLLKLRLAGIRQVKLKTTEGDPLPAARMARQLLGKRAGIRIDANMSWQPSEALRYIRELHPLGIDSIEQPLHPANLEGMAMLVRETSAEIIADEGCTDAASLEQLVAWRACRGVNVRISKCGGLMAAARRCAEVHRAGLTLQIGCQVGESSLLSAAHRILVSSVAPLKYLEGCYGRHLLEEDPAFPNLQIGRGGRAPRLPNGYGLGVEMNEAELTRWVRRRALVANGNNKQSKRRRRHVVRSQTGVFTDRPADH
jgi:muconate cycloisomerase